MSIKPIKQKLNIKDALYYQDLIYYLKKEAGFEYEQNQEIEERIQARFEEKEEEVEVPGKEYALLNRSIFYVDIHYYYAIGKIILNSSDKQHGLKMIKNYPEQVKQVIAELEEKVRTLKADTHKLARVKPTEQ